MEVKISQARPVDTAQRTEGRKKVEEGDFRFTLSRLSDENLAGRLEALMGDIATQGKQLADHMDIKDMRKYRSLVSDFIGEVVPRSHKFQRENFLDRKGRHRVYGILNLVDRDLDELAQELISSEKDHITILDKVDEIQGLLLDLLA
ncbi:MAG: YaaR family protein [Clostridiales bacterium]|jgi:uncharacterized protein YaaR (DUF327 family)|nr:YaaR family protein [Clostridiales bacterium]